MVENKEYIEKEAFKQQLLDKGFYPAIVKSTLENMPAADVVEVVRCEHCEHRNNGTTWCKQMQTFIRLDDFCSYGEKARE